MEKLTLPSSCLANSPFFLLQASTVWCLWGSPWSLFWGLHSLQKLLRCILCEMEWMLDFLLNLREVCCGTVLISQRAVCIAGALTVLGGGNVLFGQHGSGSCSLPSQKLFWSIIFTPLFPFVIVGLILWYLHVEVQKPDEYWLLRWICIIYYLFIESHTKKYPELTIWHTVHCSCTL